MNPDDYKKFYTNESNIYHNTRYGGLYGKLFEKLHHEWLTEILEHISNKQSVLEVACGTGHTSALISNLGINFIACDLTPAMIEKAKKRVESLPIKPKFMEADATNLPFDSNSFDVVISTRFLHLFNYDKQEEVLSEMIRVLKPGGSLIVDFDNWINRWLMALPYLIYNLIRYKRIAPFSIYNKIGETTNMIERLGVKVNSSTGIGGTHLVGVAAFSFAIALKIGRIQRIKHCRFLSEQFVVHGYKK
jgi:SAM-dependent methyltransferase